MAMPGKDVLLVGESPGFLFAMAEGSFTQPVKFKVLQARARVCLSIFSDSDFNYAFKSLIIPCDTLSKAGRNIYPAASKSMKGGRRAYRGSFG